MRHASQSRRHTRQKTGLALLAGVLSLALVLFCADASTAAPGKGAPAKLCEGCYGPVVMGVQMGMDFDEARQILTEYGRAHFSHLEDFRMDFYEEPSGARSFKLITQRPDVVIVGIDAEHKVVTQISFSPRYVFNLTDPTPAAAIRAFCTSGAGVPCEGWEKEKILSGAPVECYSWEDPEGKFYIQWVRPPYSEKAPSFHENPTFSIFRSEPAPEDTTAKR